MLVHDVRGYTFLDNRFTTFSALRVANGKVVAVGDSAELLRRHPGDERVDGEGRAMLPGLFDAHGHVFNLGYLFSQVGLGGMTSLGQAQAAVADYARANPQAGWIVGRGSKRGVGCTTGRGSMFGSKPAPTIKLASNTPMYRRLERDMDVNCGAVLDGEVDVGQMGQRIFDAILRHASGEPTKSEGLGLGDNEFVPWHLGIVS